MVTCAVALIVMMDTLDDHTTSDFQVISTVIQDIAFVLIGLMLVALLFILYDSLKDRLRLKELQKELEELKKRKYLIIVFYLSFLDVDIIFIRSTFLTF